MARQPKGAKRGRRGKGQVRQLRSGRWIAMFPRTVHPDRPSIASGVSFASEAEAWEALADAMARWRLGLITFVEEPAERADTPAPDRSVAAVTAAFLADNADGPGALQPTTLRGYQSDRNRVVCHPDHGIGGRNVDELTAADLQQWRTVTLARSGLSAHMIAGGWRFLRSVLSWEVEQGRLASNPAIGLRQRRRTSTIAAARSAQEVVVPTWVQEAAMVEAVDEEADRLLLLVLLRSGARFSEAASLSPDALDPASGTVRASHVWKRRDVGDWRPYPLKTGEIRDLWLPTPLAKAIADWRDNRRIPPAEGRKDVLFPFAPRSGVRRGAGVWEPSAWRSAVMVSARAAAGMPRLRTKDLRMAAASNFHDAGFSHAQVQQLLGHAPGSAVTERHYIRPTADAHLSEREAIRANSELGPRQRLDALWDAWVKATGCQPFA